VTRPSKFAPEFKARAIDLYRTSEAARSPRHTLQRAHPDQCVSTSPADPPFSSVSAATRRAQPIAPQSRASLQDLPWGRYPVTAPDKAESALHRVNTASRVTPTTLTHDRLHIREKRPSR
jgi:hypothetical protein